MIENLLVYANYMFAICMPFSHIGGYLACALGLAVLWSFHKRIEKEPVYVWLLIFIIYGLVLNMFSASPEIGSAALVGYFSHWLMPFMLGYGLLKSKYFNKIFWAFVIVFGVIVGFSVLAYFHLFYAKIGKDFYLVNEGLLKGLRSHIALAALCLLTSFLVLAQALLRKDIPSAKRIFYFVLFLFFVFALFLTGSRGYYIAALASYFLFGLFWIFRTKNWGFAVGALAVACVILCAYFFAPVVKERLQRTTSHDMNIQERLSLYKVAVAEIKSRPVFGYGPGQGIKQEKFFEMLPENLKTVGRHPALHSFYLNFAADFGLGGLVIFIGIVFFMFKGLLKSFSSDDLFLSAAGIGLFWGLVAVLIGDMFDTLLRGPGVAMELFWLTGLVLRQIREKACESAEQR